MATGDQQRAGPDRETGGRARASPPVTQFLAPGQPRYHGHVVSVHEKAAERSRALHGAVAERLRADPGLVEQARARVDGWWADGSVARPYVEAWRELLALPLGNLLERLVEPSERMHDLRQVSPFAGVLDARTRWRILRELAEASPR